LTVAQARPSASVSGTPLFAVALFDVFSLTLLLVGVFVLVASGHWQTSPTLKGNDRAWQPWDAATRA
jgi:hypothetical protein